MPQTNESERNGTTDCKTETHKPYTHKHRHTNTYTDRTAWMKWTAEPCLGPCVFSACLPFGTLNKMNLWIWIKRRRNTKHTHYHKAQLSTLPKPYIHILPHVQYIKAMIGWQEHRHPDFEAKNALHLYRYICVSHMLRDSVCMNDIRVIKFYTPKHSVDRDSNNIGFGNVGSVLLCAIGCFVYIDALWTRFGFASSLTRSLSSEPASQQQYIYIYTVHALLYLGARQFLI